MIKQEMLEGFDNIIHTYSDTGHKIRQIETGIVYDAADDVVPCRYTYEETDELVEDYEEATKEDFEMAAKILLGEVE